MELLKRTWAEISLDNLGHNYRVLRGMLQPGCRFLGVVKADAYGHGAVPVSRYLEQLGADFLAVSNLEEAVQLREAGLKLPILILGYTPPQYAPLMAEQGIRQEVNCLDFGRALSAAMAGTGKTLRIHMKLDTGMSRLGFFAERPETVDELCTLAALPGLSTEGIFAHFAVADSYEQENVAFTHLQFRRFLSVVDQLAARGVRPEIRHVANSGAAILRPEMQLDMVRPGIATYGQAPSKELLGAADLRPMMSLRTTISQIKEFQEDVTVSYGRTYTTPGPRKLAVAAIGYADGLLRRFSNSRSFLLHGQRVPIVGRICMDMCMLDVTLVPEARVGDTVTVFGRDGGAEITVDDLAEQAGTISYELLCAINKRVPRIYLEHGQQKEVLQYIV